jgi:hypothetical protein
MDLDPAHPIGLVPLEVGSQEVARLRARPRLGRDLRIGCARGPAGWRVVDIFLSGSVSQLALHRADYNSVFGRGGLAALLASLEEKAKKLAAGTEKPKAR